MNSVNLVGRVATDPQLKQISGGKQVADFRIAVDVYGDTAEFFTVKAWDKGAQYVAEHLRKGQLVSVQGRLAARSWETADGKRSTVEVVAIPYGVRRVGGSGSASGTDAADVSAPTNEPVYATSSTTGSYDDIPF